MSLNGDVQMVVLVDDEAAARERVREALAQNGFGITELTSGPEMLAQIRAAEAALVILELSLAHGSGLEVCRALRGDAALGDVPILILTACTAESDRLAAFELGVDDYVTKPFSARELVLRVKAILRGRRATPVAGEPLHCGAIAVDPARHEVAVQGRAIGLTATEYRLLYALMQAGGRVRSRHDLMRELRGETGQIEARSVDTQVRRLREKLGRAGEQIHTVRGFGYQLTERL